MLTQLSKSFTRSVPLRDSHRVKATPASEVSTRPYKRPLTEKSASSAAFFCKVAFQTREIEVSGKFMNVTLSYSSSFNTRLFSDRGHRLVGQWQCGPSTLSGCAQRKLRLSFAPLPLQLTSNNSYEHAIHLGNGNGHLPFWWILRQA